jgi:hypothetical protein
MPMKRHRPEQIVTLLGQVEVWKLRTVKPRRKPARKQRSRNRRTAA